MLELPTFKSHPHGWLFLCLYKMHFGLNEQKMKADWEGLNEQKMKADWEGLNEQETKAN